MANFFHSASDIHINNSILIGNYSPGGNPVEGIDSLRVLHDEVSSNAILNAGGRADLVRCFPGTREEVISRIEHWMTFGYLTDRRIFWLSRPAGAGKSSIVQTIAESCIQRRTPMVNFFFFRADASRNHLRPLAPTLLYQLLEFYPDMKPWAINMLMSNTLIFQKSTRDQFVNTLDKAVRAKRGNSPDWPPVVLLIDGLDKCGVASGNSDSASKIEQTRLLQILHDVVSAVDSPFIALVASRAEPHLQMAFNSTGYFKDSIYLNEDYRPLDDIRLYLVSELAKIRNTHPLGHRAGADWPPETIIKDILQKSSGQFIYASTVVRYISTSPESPSFSMDIVLGLRVLKKHSPFAELDTIYSLLSRCRHWDDVRVILAFNVMSRSVRARQRKRGARKADNRRREGELSLALLGYTEHEVESFFSDLVSLVTVMFGPDSTIIHYYHASFQDFIRDEARAGNFYIDLGEIANVLAPSLIARMSDTRTFKMTSSVLKHVTHPSNSLTVSLHQVPSFNPEFDTSAEELAIGLEFLSTLQTMYGGQGDPVFSEISESWRNWFFPLPDASDIPSEEPPPRRQRSKSDFIKGLLRRGS